MRARIEGLCPAPRPRCPGTHGTHGTHTLRASSLWHCTPGTTPSTGTPGTGIPGTCPRHHRRHPGAVPIHRDESRRTVLRVAGDSCSPGAVGGQEGVGVPPTHRKDTVSPPQLPAEVSRASSQDEGHKDPLAIFPSNNVEAQAGGAFVQDDFPGLPGRTRKGQGDVRMRSSKAGDRLFCAQDSWHTGGAGVTRVQPGVTQPSVVWRLTNQKRWQAV